MLTFQAVIDGTRDADGDYIWTLYSVDSDGMATLWEADADESLAEAALNAQALSQAICTVHRCAHGGFAVVDEHPM